MNNSPIAQQYSKFLFVHIPKTAGTSILDALRSKGLDTWTRKYVRGHDPIGVLLENNNTENTFKFAVVRNPYQRTYSAFHQYNKGNAEKISFVQFLLNIKNNIISKETPLLHLPQSFFLTLDGMVAVDKIYKFENIKELEDDIDLEIRTLNIGNYTEENFKNDYSDESIALVNQLYSIDFDNFGYTRIENIKDLIDG